MAGNCLWCSIADIPVYISTWYYRYLSNSEKVNANTTGSHFIHGLWLKCSVSPHSVSALAAALSDLEVVIPNGCRERERESLSSEKLALQQQLKQFVQLTFHRFRIVTLQTHKIQIRGVKPTTQLRSRKTVVVRCYDTRWSMSETRFLRGK